MLEFTLAALAAANKGTLRKACHAHNIAYTSLNNDAMRDALTPFASDYVEKVVQPAVDAVIAERDAVAADALDTALAALPDTAIAAALVPPPLPSDAERDAAIEAARERIVGAVVHTPLGNGNPPVATVVPRDPRALFAATKPAKVEKVRAVRVPRPEANGVKRPADTTLCGRIWAWCDAQCNAGVRPEAKVLRAALADIDPTTCTVQYYRWRKYNGITGR